MGGGNLQKTYLCETCGEMKNVDEADTHSSVTCGQMKNVDQAGSSVTSSTKCTNLNFEELERNVEFEVDEFNRKIDLGIKLKMIIEKRGFNIHALPENMKEAWKVYELYGEDMDLKKNLLERVAK